jgi:hypothetical protein
MSMHCISGDVLASSITEGFLTHTCITALKIAARPLIMVYNSMTSVRTDDKLLRREQVEQMECMQVPCYCTILPCYCTILWSEGCNLTVPSSHLKREQGCA